MQRLLNHMLDCLVSFSALSLQAAECQVCCEQLLTLEHRTHGTARLEDTGCVLTVPVGWSCVLPPAMVTALNRS